MDDHNDRISKDRGTSEQTSDRLARRMGAEFVMNTQSRGLTSDELPKRGSIPTGR